MITKILREELDAIDEDYPTGFDLKAFSQIQSFAQRKQYCDQFLKKLGAGSSRIAYQVDNDKVLKIAKNTKGIAQNEVEAEAYKDNYDICAKTLASDPNDLWLEMELAKKVSPKRFLELSGGVSIDLCQRWIHANSLREFKFVDFINKQQENNVFFQDWTNFLQDYSIQTLGDYARISSFGEVIRGGKPTLVLIDTGLNEDTFDSHYKR